MKEWLLSVVGAVCLGVLLEIVMPEGQTTKYVRGAFSLLVIFVVVSPLPSFFKNGVKLELGEIAITTDGEYLSAVGERVEGERKLTVENALLENGYEAVVEVSVEDGNPTKIVEIVVKIDESVLAGENENTYISSVQEIVAKSAGVSESVVTVEFYGSS